ncbi:IgA FC receptor-like [Siniperca chuatsi]|uniref:IgA FC receptor-like n=1 Tax=Siniperca chuatsi TaxID=119488 RepID=UPI001CE1C5AF|nr:IgA FC receptor-like [Siniperca chuatsi]
METSRKTQSKKGRNKLKTNNIQIGSSWNTVPILAADVNCKMEQTAKPEQSVKPAVERKQPQPVNPGLKSTRTNLQKGNGTVYCQKLDFIEYPQQQKEQPMHLYLKRRNTHFRQVSLPVRAAEKTQPNMPPEEQVAAISEEPQASAAPEEPQASAAPEEPQASAAPEEPEASAAPEEPQASAAPEEPQASAAPEEPEASAAPEEPQASAAPEEPEASGAPEEPQASAAPEEPQASAAPEEPQASAAPEEPEASAAPEEPQVAAISEEPEASAAPEEPKPDVTPEEPQVAVAPKGPQVTMESKSVEAFYKKTGVKMIEVSELDFMDKDEETTRLRYQQAYLITKVERLKESLQTQTALNTQADVRHKTRIKTLQRQIINREFFERETLRKIRKLEEALEKELNQQKKVETSLAHQREENSRLVAALVQAEEDLKRETLKWEEEKSSLLQMIEEQQQQQQQALQQKTTGDHLKDRIVDLEQKMAVIDKKPKRRSLWKRFLQVFK